MFCNNINAMDSIDLITQCDATLDLFPRSMKTNHANRVPPNHFSFYGLDGRHRLAVALMLCAIQASIMIAGTQTTTQISNCVW